MKTVDKSSYNNDWYRPGPLWKRLLWQWTSALFFQNGFFPFSGFKAKLLRLFGAKIGLRPTIKPNVTIKYPWFLTMGDYVGIGEFAWIDNLAQVNIGNQVTISQGAFLLTGNHNYTTVKFELMIGEINIEDGVWVGARSIVGPNTTLHSHSVIGVGSIITKDTEAYQIYSGNPAVKVKERIIK